ncbi:hypothetical protein [Streptomyces sp. NPDC003717]|uniref:hypothetical protein n=1 Tax=Streptomyces sp. NPDC003717 TaxID=3154276 RepID=UPI0033BDB2F4
MTADQTEALIGMAVTFGLLLLVTLPSLLGVLRDRRMARQIKEARRARENAEAQKSSSRSTVPSTATWYADGRRSKKLVNS